MISKANPPPTFAEAESTADAPPTSARSLGRVSSPLELAKSFAKASPPPNLAKSLVALTSELPFDVCVFSYYSVASGAELEASQSNGIVFLNFVDS